MRYTTLSIYLTFIFETDDTSLFLSYKWKKQTKRNNCVYFKLSESTKILIFSIYILTSSISLCNYVLIEVFDWWYSCTIYLIDDIVVPWWWYRCTIFDALRKLHVNATVQYIPCMKEIPSGSYIPVFSPKAICCWPG